MQLSTRAIVLSKIKYKDHDLIVTCYTEQLGVVSYIIRGVFKTSRSHKKAAYFQLLSQLQIEASHKENASLQYIKDVKANVVYTSLHSDVLKSSVVMFLSEILANVLKEEEANENLFSFIEHALQWLDAETFFSNFHMVFLLKLTQHLGFYPDTSNSFLPYFNLQEGGFQQSASSYTISGENLTRLKSLLGINFDALQTIKISSNDRQILLNIILKYYAFHIEGFKTPKSLAVFNQVFN